MADAGDGPGVRAGAAGGERRGGTRCGTRTPLTSSALAEAAAAAVRAGGDWAGRLDADLANLRAALAWLDAHGPPADLLRLAAAVADFLNLAGHLAEGRAWLERALAASDSGPPTPARALALVREGQIAAQQGEDAAAEALLGEGLALARRLGTAEPVAPALEAFGVAAEDRGDYDLAERFLVEAAAACRDAGDRPGEANAVAHLGVVAYGRGDLALATARLEQALAVARGLRQPAAAYVAHLYLGHVAGDQGDVARAAAAYPRSSRSSNRGTGTGWPAPSPAWQPWPRRAGSTRSRSGCSGRPRRCGRRSGWCRRCRSGRPTTGRWPPPGRLCRGPRLSPPGRKAWRWCRGRSLPRCGRWSPGRRSTQSIDRRRQPGPPRMRWD